MSYHSMKAPLSKSCRLSVGTRTQRIPVSLPSIWRRGIQISNQSANILDIDGTDTTSTPIGDVPDARFEVLGSPFSLLSVSLSASQNLYTRRGTLVSVGGNPENAISTLSILEPFRRAFLRIPFLYQRISSTTPVTALISTKASSTSMTTVNLDGTTDWMLTGKALLAWTGQTISVRPSMNRSMSLAHWGSSEVTGRGILALSGLGSISQVILQSGESSVIHPSNVIAYSINPNPPLPYRLKSSSFRLQIPELGLSRFLPDTRFVQALRESYSWQTLTTSLFTLRTWARRTIWGDRLFLQFHGPTTILLQTRPSRISDVLTSRDINEIAETQPGVVQPIVTLSREETTSGDPEQKQEAMPVTIKAPRMSTASIGSDGKVTFKPPGESKSRS